MSSDYIIITSDELDDPQLELDLSSHDNVTSTGDVTINLGDYGAACETITMSTSGVDTITLPTTYTVGYGGTGGTSSISYVGNGSGSTMYTTSTPYQWTSTTASPTFTIMGGSDESTVKISGDKPTLSTDQGSVNVNDIIEVVNAMKQMIVEMAKDDDLPPKYQWVKDIAHDWMIKALKGTENKNEEDN